MFYVSDLMAALWWTTGLGTFTAKRTTTVAGGGGGVGRCCGRLSVVYAAAVYAAYAFLSAASVAGTLEKYEPGPRSAETDGQLYIRIIRDLGMALLFVATTAVYWSAAAYRGQHARVHDERAAVANRLFGNDTGRSSSHRAVDAWCWALYALLAVVLSLDVSRYGLRDVSWTYAAAYVWGHYTLLTGNIQFAVTVFGLRQCYRELNARMRAGRPERRSNAFDCARSMSTQPPPAPDYRRDDVTFVGVLDKVNLLTMLKYWFDIHWSITQIVSGVNDLFKFRLFVFFLCGLLHLMLTPYVLSLTILNEDIDILAHMTEQTLWFVIHVFRVFLIIYPCALLAEEAAKTQILLGSYLSTKIDFFDIKIIETYVQHLDVNKPEFSIYSMFVVDRQLVITLTGAVATYLVIILQIQGQA